MRLRLLYLYRNLTRNILRTMLTASAVALPVVVYVLSMAVVQGINEFLDNSAKQLRLAITHKTSIINRLPESYRTKIESLDPDRTRLLSVCGINFLGGSVENSQRPLSTLATDADTFVDTFPENRLTAEEAEQWSRDRQAVAVGSATAGHFGWNVGDRVTIRPSIPPYTPMEFHVISILPNAKDAITIWCRRDYYDAELKRLKFRQGEVSFFFARCASPAALDRFRADIDQMFANTPDETKTQDEKSFMNEYISQQFDLPRNLTILASVTVIVAVLAAANTMSMNLRDRIGEFATLKAMGFSGKLVFGLVQVESLTLCAVGGAIGALSPYIAFTYTPLRDITVPLIQHLKIEPSVCVQGMAISAIIGLLAALWPSWQAAKLPVIAALRNLE